MNIVPAGTATVDDGFCVRIELGVTDWTFALNWLPVAIAGLGFAVCARNRGSFCEDLAELGGGEGELVGDFFAGFEDTKHDVDDMFALVPLI